MVWALAHPRGGGELGRRWYLDGKLLNKVNTFTDFLACAEHLVAEGIAAPGTVAIRGGSAGGLLVGAAVAMRPDLPAAVVAEVPFVDVVTTMLDPSLPLTSPSGRSGATRATRRSRRPSPPTRRTRTSPRSTTHRCS